MLYTYRCVDQTKNLLYVTYGHMQMERRLIFFFYRRQSTKQEDFHSAEVLDSIAINAVQS